MDEAKFSVIWGWSKERKPPKQGQNLLWLCSADKETSVGFTFITVKKHWKLNVGPETLWWKAESKWSSQWLTFRCGVSHRLTSSGLGGRAIWAKLGEEFVCLFSSKKRNCEQTSRCCLDWLFFLGTFSRVTLKLEKGCWSSGERVKFFQV